MIILLIFIFIAAITLFVLRNHTLIRRNTPSISFVVIFGLFLFCISGIFLSLGIYDITCYLNVFLYNVEVGILLGGIIAKEYRVYRIFSNKSATAIEISDLKLFLIVFLIALYFFLIACLTIFGDLQAEIQVSASDRFYLFVKCTLKTKTISTLFSILTNCSLFLFRIVAVILAWLTRRVDNVYSESRQVGVLVTILICVILIFTPIFESLKNGTGSAIYKSCILFIAITITIAATLILLFYYRFWMVYRYEQRKKDKLRITREFEQ